MPYMVKEVADLTGISVRTLHHYDEIGLLSPGAVTPAGYRLYTERELERLQQILFFKEIGFTLHEIGTILGSPGFDRKRALVAHKELLEKRLKRLEDIIRTVDETIASIEGGKPMTTKDMFGSFDTSPIEEHKKKYAKEARELYGEAVVGAAEKRVESYKKEDWADLESKWSAIYQKIIAAMDRGPADRQVQEALHELRMVFCERFYDCTPEIFRGLGDLYVNDARFTANIDKYKTGLAAFMRDGMHIYYDNHVAGKGF